MNKNAFLKENSSPNRLIPYKKSIATVNAVNAALDVNGKLRVSCSWRHWSWLKFELTHSRRAQNILFDLRIEYLYIQIIIHSIRQRWKYWNRRKWWNERLTGALKDPKSLFNPFRVAIRSLDTELDAFKGRHLHLIAMISLLFNTSGRNKLKKCSWIDTSKIKTWISFRSKRVEFWFGLDFYSW